MLAFHTRGVPRVSFCFFLFLSSPSNFSQSLIYEQFSTIVCTVTGPIRSFSRWLHVMLESRARQRSSQLVSAPSLSSSVRRHRGMSSHLSSSNLFGPFYEERNAKRSSLPLDASHDCLFRRESETLRKFYGIFAPRNVVAQDVTIFGRFQPLINRFPFLNLWNLEFYEMFEGSYILSLSFFYGF